MADKSSRRLKVVTQKVGTSVASLAANSSVEATAIAPTRNCRVAKLDVFADAKHLQTDEAVLVGLADADLSTTEIEECLESAGSDPGDIESTEYANRPVFPLGILNWLHPSAHFKWDKQWTFLEDKGWSIWFYNMDGSALSANNQEVQIFQKALVVWL